MVPWVSTCSIRGKIVYCGTIKDRRTVPTLKREEKRFTMSKGKHTVSRDLWDVLEPNNNGGLVARGCEGGVGNLVSRARRLL